jgi:hypothetical protein
MSRKKVILLSVAILAALFIQPMALSQAAGTQHPGHSGLKSYYPTAGTGTSTASSLATGLGPVTYHPGEPIISEPNIYVIWYGNWDANSCTVSSDTSSTPSIVNDFLSSLGESDWNKINTTYYQVINGNKTFVQPTGEIKGCTVDDGSQGLSLDTDTGAQVSDVVEHSLSTKALKTDPNGVYLVLTASNVKVADFMARLCAYHWVYDNSQATIKYAFIGDATKNLASCASQLTISPNANPAADAMVSVIAHEFVEAVSDPSGTSWFDQVGLENADKCAWNYGKVSKIENGSFANMTLDNRQYLIQQNVAANSNTCVLSLKGNESDHNSGTHK